MTESEIFKVIDAYQKGKIVEFRPKELSQVKPEDEMWEKVDSIMTWNFVYYDYRIKPESKIRPFNSPKEFLKALNEHGGWMYRRLCYLFIPVTIEPDFITTYDGEKYTFEQVLKLFEFCDGTPCGITESN